MPASLNKVMIIGRLGRDPELRYTQSGQPVANLRMATDESYRDRDGKAVERTEWHSVVVWGRQAETVSNYVGKGSLIYVEGSLQTRDYEDQQGQKRYVTEVKAMRVQFLDPRGGREQGEDQRPAQGQGRKEYDARSQEQHDPGPAFPADSGGMDDVPF